MNKDVVLPSGAKLHITTSPFRISKTLYQALLQELKALNMDPKAEVDVNLFKDVFCAGFSSPAVELALSECMKRVTYNGVKVTEDTFEPDEAREDYISACVEVTVANVAPFFKNLTQQFSAIAEKVSNFQKSK